MFVLSISVALLSCGVSGLAPTITEGEKGLAIESILENSEVRKATIAQSERKLSLVLVVGEGTSTERSQEIGEAFVRLSKSFGPDGSPSTEIGSGIFDYLISVTGPNGEVIVSGAKAQASSIIIW